jgi:acyl-CoA reductase-like NAD-dependent aldehyde dehydrogenase
MHITLPQSQSHNGWAAKVDRLSAKSQEFKALTLEDRLELIDAIIYNAEVLGDGLMADHDMALQKMAPDPYKSNDNPSSAPNYQYSSDAENLKGFYRLAFLGAMIPYLQGVKENLEYRIELERESKENDQGSIKKSKVKKPPLLAKTREAILGGRQIRIHGPVEMFPLFHEIQVWADAGLETKDPIKPSPEDDDEEDSVCVVLGAGNANILTFIDTLHSIFYHPATKPIFIKYHPLRPYLQPVFAKLFEPLIERGFLDHAVDEGLEATIQLLQNPKTSHVHVTGGLATARAIENTLAEAQPNKSKGKIESMVTSELGCVTPFLIAPGKYTKRELKMAANHIVTPKKMNGGAYCFSPQVAILPEEWAQREEFRKILVETVRKIPADPCYFPGATKRVQNIVNHYVGDDEKGEGKTQPHILQQAGARMKRSITDGDDDGDFLQPAIVDCGTYGSDTYYNNKALRMEAFGPLLATVNLPGDPSESYLTDVAVPFVNNKENIFGSLSCSIIYPKKFNQNVIEEATAGLNYGCVGWNTATLYGYLGVGSGGIWGASVYDNTGETGRGRVGNVYEIPNVAKSVVSSRSLTFPLIFNKELVPPKFCSSLVSAALLRFRRKTFRF